MKAFCPRLEILPEGQRRLCPTLTALAPLDRQALGLALPWLASAQVLQEQPETLTLLAPVAPDHEVKVSFFGGLAIGRVADPKISDDGVAKVALPLDLLTTKLKVLLQRAERKDYLDVAALLEAGLSRADGLAAASELYGSAFPPEDALKALVYFADGDLPELPIAVQQYLAAAVLAVDALPRCERFALDLSGLSPNA